MQVKVEAAGPCRKRMRVRAMADEIGGEFTTVVAEYRTHGRVPGFRKGKAPAALVERHYARDILESVKDRLVPRFYRQAMEKEGIQPVAVIDVEDVQIRKDEGLAFDVLIDMPPDFKLPKYKKLALTRPSSAVTDEDVGKAIERIQERYGRYADANDGAVADHDLVQMDYEGAVEGRRVKEFAGATAELDEGHDFWMPIGSMSMNFLPGLSAGVVGARVGETRTVEVTFPADFNVESLRGLTAKYTVTVKGRRAPKPAELNEEFLKNLGMESVEALRTRVRQDMQEAAEARAKQALRDEAAKQLLERADFDLPQSVVEEETRLAVRSMLEHVISQGATSEQIEANQERIMQTAAESSKERVRLGYILARIADEEQVAVDEAELTQRLEGLAQRYKMPPEQVRAELEKRNGLERVKSDIRGDKAMELVIENAKIKEG